MRGLLQRGLTHEQNKQSTNINNTHKQISKLNKLNKLNKLYTRGLAVQPETRRLHPTIAAPAHQCRDTGVCEQKHSSGEEHPEEVS